MIYVDMKCFSMRKYFDIKFDETMAVEELITRVAETYPFNKESANIISVDKRRMLCKQESFYKQGVIGGDTLILVECGDD